MSKRILVRLLLMKHQQICTNDIHILNSLQLHVSVTSDHHQGALLQSAVVQRYVHSSKIYLYICMSSKIQSSCCMLTSIIKKVKKIVEMFKMSCVTVRALRGGDRNM